MTHTLSLSLVIITAYFLIFVVSESEDFYCKEKEGGDKGKPFSPWFRQWPNLTSGPGPGSGPAWVDNMACWWFADCIMRAAAETRKQQYAAMSFVMGLLPLTLKDIAWPERRDLSIRKESGWATEIFVRAVGLNPQVVDDMADYGKTFKRKWQSKVVLLLLIVFFLLSYGCLAVMEIYSKRSSLGCPVPAFIVLWYVVGLLPAAVEVAFGKIFPAKKPQDSSNAPVAMNRDTEAGRGSAPKIGDSTIMISQDSDSGDNGVPNRNKRPGNSPAKPSQNIQGGDKHWIVQFCWAIYYAGGSLLFNSIMLVTTYELFVWMLLASLATAAGKMLGYRLSGYWTTE